MRTYVETAIADRTDKAIAKSKAAVCDGGVRYGDSAISALKSPHDAGLKL
ncbi:hypothetical protein L4D04_21495 [Photobacterium angustum]|uniref:Uncharacterized protein n=1 Tax=Photobacterium angustum (strain S14 / CCUG 15956) TaxID=314292 RepID=Q1ZSW6_PHOAS|nr:hypothetical protein [Photobacterium angustum]EAS64861.1 hypothetical protein VAS14_04058 [Photobacterium angustum S14]